MQFLALLPSKAASSPGITVQLVDAESHAPVVFATVDLYGPTSLRGVTDTNGIVAFPNLPKGRYTIVAAVSPYESQHVRDVYPVSTQSATLVLYLTKAPPPLQTIATIKSRNVPQVSNSSVGQADRNTALKQSLFNAFADMPDVTLINGVTDMLSVRGYQPDQIGLTINGTPVGPLGASTDMHLFNADLFSAIGIDSSSATASPAGDINFKLRQPTLAWLGNASEIQGSYGNSASSLSEGGTVGRLGIAYSYATRSQGDSLDGQQFLDSSGLFYSHDTVAKTAGQDINIRYPFSTRNVFFASTGAINSSVPIVCRTFTGRLPCGYGPNNWERSTLNFTQLRDAMYFTRGDASITLFSSSVDQSIDESNLYDHGIHLPQYSQGMTRLHGASLAADIMVSATRSVQIQGSTTSQTTSSAGSAFGSLVPPLAQTLTYNSVSASTTVVQSRRMSAGLSIGSQSTLGTRNTFASASVRFRPTNADTMALSLGSGALSVPAGLFKTVSAPEFAQINCDARSALGGGPRENGAKSETSSVALTWTHDGRKVQSQVTVYHNNSFATNVTGIVRADALSPALIPPSYIAALNARYHDLCGSAPDLSLNNLFFSVSSPTERTVYSGADLVLSFPLGNSVVAAASYGLNFARPYGNTFPLFSDKSTVIANTQLPNVPISKFDLEFGAALGSTNLTALARLHHVSGNNPNNLPAYTTVDLGLLMPTNNGVMAISFLNALNQHPGAFATNIDAVPLPMARGAYPTIATPLSPRTVVVGYRFRLGPNDIGGAHDDFSSPGFLTRYYPVTSSPPSNALVINTQASSCGPETLSMARRALSTLSGYVNRINDSRTGAGYPAALPSMTSDGLQYSYRPNGADDYAVLISTERGTRSDSPRALLSCGIIHSGRLATLQRYNIFVPDYEDAETAILLYSPKTGLYATPPLIDPPVKPRLPALPVVPPAEPFAISDNCPAQMRPAAKSMLNIIKEFATSVFVYHQRPLEPDQLQIAVMSSASKQWLQVTDPHSRALTELSACLKLTAASKAKLEQLGYSGLTWIQGINYTPSLGLYVRQ
jgi:hypothetical protein